jgi:WD40 repeat protein
MQRYAKHTDMRTSSDEPPSFEDASSLHLSWSNLQRLWTRERKPRSRVRGLAFLVAVTFGASAALGPSTALAASGYQRWAAQYNGPGNFTDEARSLAVSPDGDTVFVAGGSWGSTSGYDYATLAYDTTTGAQLWEARYEDGDIANSVGVSPDGSKVFVTGEGGGSTGNSDYATVAYDASSGQELWVARYNGPGDSGDLAWSLAVGPDGNTVFVTGFSVGSHQSTDYATLAYDATTGLQLWVARYSGPGKGDSVAFSVAVSPDGAQVFATGVSYRKKTGADYATVAYDATKGHKKWVARYNGPGNDSDQANSVAVSPDGAEVLVTGASIGTATGYDYATLAYDARKGKTMWVARYGGPGAAFDWAHSVAVSPDGTQVFVTGGSGGVSGNLDYATVAYDAATGDEQWPARYEGSGNSGGGVAFSVAVSPDGTTVFVTGYSPGGTSYDAATLAYEAANGQTLWSARYNGPGNDFDIATSVAVSPDGAMVFVTGGTSASATGEDFATVGYQA